MRAVSTSFEPLRVLTYNVHACRGRDRVISPSRIAEVIAAAGPDVVALQEVDVARQRSDRRDQAELIARELNMDFHFAPAMRLLEEEFGDAILTARPIRLVKAGALPSIRFPVRLEPRGVLWTEIQLGSAKLQMLTTHLGLVRRERRMQAEALCGLDWLANMHCGGPTVLAGDFNFLSRSRAYAHVTSRLHDAQRLVQGPHEPTFPARFPRFRIDYIFVSHAIRVDRIEVLRTGAARVASDHLPLIADLRIPVAAPSSMDASRPWAFDHA